MSDGRTVEDLLREPAPRVLGTLVDGPTAALALLDRLATDDRSALADHHRMHAVRAHLLEMAGDAAPAMHHYRRAAALTTGTPEQRCLTTKAARLHESSPPPLG
ncbi:hypothetical protein ACFVU0_21370 [Streptomyces sp. NPDC058122]|uniref:hypothetical protein n=1 Tax=Streptomyces sp. NPDC058122 TaxID=3346349 RepID=UPI0036E5554A